MNKRENFTAGRIAAFKCEPGKTQHIYWDGKTPGLGLRVTPAGIKSFIFETRLNGKTLRMTIGDVRTWAIDAAQQEATRLKAMTDKGDDPRQVKAEKLAETEAKREKAKNAEAPALEVWQSYLVAKTPRWSARSLIDHQRLAAEGGKLKTRGRKKGEGDKTNPGILLPLLRLPLAEIDADAVRQWLKNETTRPTQANNAFVRLRAFLNWCADRPDLRDFIHADACTARIARDELPKQKAKDDCLQREQLALWFQHVQALQNIVQSAYLQALLLTGARREELAGLTWDNVDFQWKSLTIRDKVEGERTIPLTPYVASLLAALPRRNEWVFSSPMAASGRLQEPRIGHRKALIAAGLPALTLHGLRRSFGTLAEWVECPAGVSAQIMGHKPTAIAEKHYRKRPLDLLRMWHTKIEAWILEQAGIEQPYENATSLQLVKGSTAA
ncbi:tyrosine-type recombinase/integrase [Propionivibrio sp.]|uniref:tyrosine-type recombinase/integrase n=1 Tax=Propionivibrio sp. TaxID=2212460 RepID=UPI00272E5890|nr:integrase family protein [Propionivibrio sp.]